jgi:uncharacterized protein (DUF1501 family)
MLTLFGQKQAEFCDGQTRRDFLRVGSLALGGLSLPQLLQAEATANTGSNNKGIIMIFLAGGPPHQDMFDLKPHAPAEIRGEFNPIPTNVSGMEICELMPKLAKLADKYSIIRSLYDNNGGHSSYQVFSGYPGKGKWPSVGSFASRVLGSTDPSVPAFVGLSPKCGHTPWANPGEPGWLGSRYAAFQADDGPGMANMVLNSGISTERFTERKTLYRTIDDVRRRLDKAAESGGLDPNLEQAFNVLASSKLVDALDVTKADQALRERYGRGTKQKMSDGSWRLMDQFLVARRLIEAGARVVTLAFSRWDWHGGNFNRARQDLPMLDQGLSALVEDIHNRGLQDDISVVVWGEFGRTPKINKNAGRDHWPAANFAFLAGGGMRTGQVIGATDKHAARPTKRLIHPQEVLATLYHNIGMKPQTTTVIDHAGRPQYLLDRREPIEELVG